LPKASGVRWSSGFRGEDFLENNQSETRIAYGGGPSIDASYQVSLHLAEGFQRRRLKCEKLTDDRKRTPEISKKIFFSETALPNESKLGRKHPWKVLYKDC
jgi:hypothetical protein